MVSRTSANVLAAREYRRVSGLEGKGSGDYHFYCIEPFIYLILKRRRGGRAGEFALTARCLARNFGCGKLSLNISLILPRNDSNTLIPFY